MKIWVLTATPSFGGTKKLVHGFESETEAKRIAEIIEACEPRLTLDLEVIEVDVQQLRLLDPMKWPTEPAPEATPAWWQAPAMSGVDLARGKDFTGVHVVSMDELTGRIKSGEVSLTEARSEAGLPPLETPASQEPINIPGPTTYQEPMPWDGNR